MTKNDYVKLFGTGINWLIMLDGKQVLRFDVLDWSAPEFDDEVLFGAVTAEITADQEYFSVDEFYSYEFSRRSWLDAKPNHKNPQVLEIRDSRDGAHCRLELSKLMPYKFRR